jgi:outer membrane protein assembly factor BamB
MSRHLRRIRPFVSLGLLVAALVWLGSVLGRVDRARSGTDDSPALPRTLHLQWVRELPTPQPAWPDQVRLQFDVAYRPTVHEGTLFLASHRTDSVTAYDSASGEKKWQFFTDGPVRFAPTVREKRVYFTSDDGYLYCLDMDGGRLLWKVRGGPTERRILGNERLISTWPARGAPVVSDDGIVYFAAGVWPFMGIFLHAVDARSGAVVWTNSGDGSTFMKQPHHADAYGGVAPQGPLVVAGNRLLVPGGRSVPACYDRRTGKLLYYRLDENSKKGGGWEALVRGSFCYNGGGLFDVATGAHLGAVGEPAVLGEVMYAVQGDELRAFDLRNTAPRAVEGTDRKGNRTTRSLWEMPQLASVKVPRVETMIRAGRRLYAGTPGGVFALDLPLRSKPRISWRAAITGTPAHLLAADGRLYVSTREGKLYCFAASPAEPKQLRDSLPFVISDEAAEARARTILETSGVREGYVVVWGIGEGRVLRELVRQSDLRIIAIDPDAGRIAALRAQLLAEGIHGDRLHLLAGEPDRLALPPYCASLIVSEHPQDVGLENSPDALRRAYESLRPYGGKLMLAIAAEQRRAFTNMVEAEPDMPQAKMSEGTDWIVLSRDGPLPGAADWTHEHADAANTRVSRDRRVKAPLGVLWFGGPGNDGILPRHGHGPQPQVVDGRLIIEGVDKLRCLDIYTGRMLWETSLPGVGAVFDNMAHQPGANASGTNYITTADGVYVLHGTNCVRLDIATGKTLDSFPLPTPSRGKRTPVGGYINVWKDYLILGVSDPENGSKPRKASPGSQRLAVLDRISGRVLWSVSARSGFRNNALCVGNGRLFAIDRPGSDLFDFDARRGETRPTKARLLALDLATGRKRWSTEKDLFGTWLSYSAEHDVLVEAGRNARDTLSDEPRGMRAYRADNGKVLWHQSSYVGPAMIHGDVILKDQSACELLTGKPLKKPDPLTGEPVEWKWTRTYGCNTPAAAEHLLTFRSGAAGYYDLACDGGTGNFGGFRSSCTHNLVVAGGLITAPDYTRTCTCSYQNQTSIALVPMPDAEMWTFFGAGSVRGPVRQVGIKLGAPGSRRADNGTLWQEYPAVGGPTPRIAVASVPARLDTYRRHSAEVEGDVPHWIAASGARNLRSLTIPLALDASKERRFTVRLYFSEPDAVEVGQRLIDVSVQGQTFLTDFDVCQEAGGRLRGIVKEMSGIKVRKDLTITLAPSPSSSLKAPVLSGVEVIAEGW